MLFTPIRPRLPYVARFRQSVLALRRALGVHAERKLALQHHPVQAPSPPLHDLDGHRPGGRSCITTSALHWPQFSSTAETPRRPYHGLTNSPLSLRDGEKFGAGASSRLSLRVALGGSEFTRRKIVVRLVPSAHVACAALSAWRRAGCVSTRRGRVAAPRLALLTHPSAAAPW